MSLIARTVDGMKVTAVIRTTETSTVVGEGPNYDAARAAADALVPEGYQVLSYAQERDS